MFYLMFYFEVLKDFDRFRSILEFEKGWIEYVPARKRLLSKAEFIYMYVYMYLYVNINY